MSTTTTSDQPKKCCNEEKTLNESCCVFSNAPSVVNQAQPKTCCSQEDQETANESCSSCKNASTSISADNLSTTNQTQTNENQGEATVKENCCPSMNAAANCSDTFLSPANSAQGVKCRGDEEATTIENYFASESPPEKPIDDAPPMDNLVQHKKCGDDETTVNENCCSSMNLITEPSNDTSDTTSFIQCNKYPEEAIRESCCSSKSTAAKSSGGIVLTTQHMGCCTQEPETIAIKEHCCSSKNQPIGPPDDISVAGTQTTKCHEPQETVVIENCCSGKGDPTKCSEGSSPPPSIARTEKDDQQETVIAESCCSSNDPPIIASDDILHTTKPVQAKTCCSQEETVTSERCSSCKDLPVRPASKIVTTIDNACGKKCCNQEDPGINQNCSPSKTPPLAASDDISHTISATSIQPTECCSQEEKTASGSSCSSKNTLQSDVEANSAFPKCCQQICCTEGGKIAKETCHLFTNETISSKGDSYNPTSITKPKCCCPIVVPGAETVKSCCSIVATDPHGSRQLPTDALLRTSSDEMPAEVTSQPSTDGTIHEPLITDALSDESLSPEDNATKLDIDVLRVCTTKLRVQNVCCPKESYIVEEELSKLDGVNTVKVNQIGRVVYVSHNPDLVSPTELVVALNRRHLGASIVDTGTAEDTERGLPKPLKMLAGFLALQVILVAIALTAMLMNASWYMWVAIAEVCVGIMPVLKKCVHAIRNRNIDLNILITLTVIGTLVIQEWIEGAAVVFVFMLANFLQQYCFYRVHKTVSSLMLSKPSNAVIASTGECVPIEKVPVGSIIAVRQGELIPLDGIVVNGNASVDESSITGEAVPIEKSVEMQTYSGTVIQHGYLEIQTTSSSTSSTMSKISAMVEEAQTNVSPTEIMVNKFAKYYTPLVVLLAALVFLIPLILGLSGVDAYKNTIKTWGVRALIVMVTACPCALLMATPIVVICGISGAARLGILIKGGTFLEALSQMKFLAFDKTGTLTEGKFQVIDILAVDPSVERDVLRRVAALESKSSHPLAAAVVTAFTGECIADFAEEAEELLPDVRKFRTLEAQGISGVVEEHLVHVGNLSLLEKLGVKLPPKFETAYNTFCAESKTVVFACVDRELAVMISLADAIRDESYIALPWLQDLGVKLTMLTGDSKLTATAVQQELKLDSIVSEMKPHEKLEWITQTKADSEPLRRRGLFRKKTPAIVGMVGDGVNDGPALAAADVGVAMAAAGSALAVEAAGIALMTNSVIKVPEMICLSRFCRRLIFQNIIMSVLLKIVFVVIALSGFVRVWMAVLADLVGLVVVIVNGLRPLKWEPPRPRKKSEDPAITFKNDKADYDYVSIV